jgi:ATP-dependent helicase/nuclease subunit A
VIDDLRIADRKERAYITTHVRENMCVEAGAGTGKTTVLVQRIINTVASGQCDVRHMAVITFTEKAAAELAGRVRRGLEDALAAAADTEQAARIETALRGLNHAHIETIHAFAASLLRERPIEAGLDPGFEVMDILPSQLAFESAYREWLNGEMAADPPPPALLEALDLGLTIERVREAAEALHRYRFLLPLDPYDRVDVDVATFTSIAPDAAVLAAMHGAARDEEDQAYQAALAVAEWFSEISVLRADDATFRRAIAAFKMPSFSRGAQRNWRDPDDCRAAGSLRQSRRARRRARRHARERRRGAARMAPGVRAPVRREPP